MQTPVPREQVQLTPDEAVEFWMIADSCERVEEHLLDSSLMFYVTR